MTNREATAIFTLASHICGQQVMPSSGIPAYDGLPTDDAVLEALVHLVERAHKHLMCGPSPERVRELWEQRERRSP